MPGGQAVGATLYVVNAELLEPETGQLTPGSWIEISGDRISATGTGAPPAPGGALVIDAAAATVLPGLIDAHVHLAITSLDAADVASWTPGYATVRGLAAAGRMLRRGFTTVRDVGGADHGMARAISEGLAEGPRLFFGGKALSQTGGHGDARGLEDDHIPGCQHRPGFARIADGVAAVRAAARDELRKGASHIKMCVSGGVASPHDEISAVQYGAAELRAAVEEAENHGRYVTVHAYHPRAIRHAVQAGVRCVEHGNLLDEETAALLADRGVYLVPTLITYEQLATRGRELGMAERSYRKIAEVRDQGLAALERAAAAGVSIAFGTDLLAEMQQAQLQELTLRAQVQPPVEIIRAATCNAARLLGMAGQLGTLQPGALADLLVVRGNPLADIGILASPEENLRFVVKGGTVTTIAG
jgi:imidazolonepropionase-like amidohydrolase